MAGVVRGLRFNAPLAAARLAATFAGATDLAEIITLETGLDFRSAHRVVGRLVRDALTAGRQVGEITPADLDAAAQVVLGHPLHLPNAALDHALDPATAVEARRGIGGAAPVSLATMVAECRAALAVHSAWHEQTTFRISAAESALLSRARELSAGFQPMQDNSMKGIDLATK
jgi:argininosuccinate lyase